MFYLISDCYHFHLIMFNTFFEDESNMKYNIIYRSDIRFLFSHFYG